MFITLLTFGVWATVVSGSTPIPHGCELFDRVINGGQPLVSIIGRRGLNRSLIDSLSLVQSSILQTLSGMVPWSQETASTCRISGKTPSTTELEFLRAVQARQDVQACYICDDLQLDKGQCDQIGFCPGTAVCFSGLNRDFYAGYERNATLNTYLYPAAVSHGCCDPAHDQRCRTGVTQLLHTANYTLQTCTAFICNADSPSQNTNVLNFLATTPTTTLATATTTKVTHSTTSQDCQDAPHSKCDNVELLSLMCDIPGAASMCIRSCGLCPDQATTATTTVAATTTTKATHSTTSSDCQDSPHSNCDNVDLLSLLCDIPEAASTCRRSCGLCPDQDCSDKGNCTQELMGLVCGDDMLARAYCQKSCFKCNTR